MVGLIVVIFLVVVEVELVEASQVVMECATLGAVEPRRVEGVGEKGITVTGMLDRSIKEAMVAITEEAVEEDLWAVVVLAFPHALLALLVEGPGILEVARILEVL